MNKKNSFTKFLIREKKRDMFHSSAYAKAQSGGNMGATSTESFERRQEVDANRQAVRRYKESQVGRNWVNRTPQAMAVGEESGADMANSDNAAASGAGAIRGASRAAKANGAGEVKSGNVVAEARARFSAGSKTGPQAGNARRPNFKPNFGR